MNVHRSQIRDQLMLFVAEKISLVELKEALAPTLFAADDPYLDELVAIISEHPLEAPDEGPVRAAVKDFLSWDFLPDANELGRVSTSTATTLQGSGGTRTVEPHVSPPQFHPGTSSGDTRRVAVTA